MRPKEQRRRALLLVAEASLFYQTDAIEFRNVGNRRDNRGQEGGAAARATCGPGQRNTSCFSEAQLQIAAARGDKGGQRGRVGARAAGGAGQE